MSNTQAVATKIDGFVQESPDRPDKSATTGSPEVCLYAPPRERPYALYFYVIMVNVLLIGLYNRQEEYLIAESGLGYNLGIVGGVMMLLLLLYPLRKKARFMQRWGATRYWFQVHMILGILGPVLILFHANFQTGSLNSTVVLTSMLLVAGSGLVGRYLYSKIHYGLYGRLLTLKDLKKEIEIGRSSLVFGLDYAPQLKHQLRKFETLVLMPHHGLLRSIWYILITVFWAKWTHIILLFGLRHVLKVTAKRAGWSASEQKQHERAARRHISTHISTIIRVSYFGFYEKLFALWHLFHLPLFIVLVITGLVHVISVHMY